MLTREYVDSIFEQDNDSFTQRNVDHDVIAIRLLRDRIPYEKCKSIIGGAEHDKIYLCDVDDILDYFDEQDLAILVDCNVGIDEDTDSFYLFV